MTILVIIILALLIGMVAARSVIVRKQNKMLETFLLPAGSEKESFMDEKTGKRYDKEAYDAHLREMVSRFSVAQLESIARSGNPNADVWNTLLCRAAQAELHRRHADAAVQEEEEECAMDEINDRIAPFFWVEQDFGASIGLSTGEYLQELFDAHKDAGFTGSAADWEKLAEAFLAKHEDLAKGLQFESQGDLFGVYCRDDAALKKFIFAFHKVCEDRAAAEKLFASVK